MQINHPPRPNVSVEDLAKAIQDLQNFQSEFLKEQGTGAFIHPHEIVGCMTGQLFKLSIEADKVVYTDDVAEFRQRCIKAASPLIFAIASLDVLSRT